MAEFYKFIFGLATNDSTPEVPELDVSNYYEFIINPRTWDGVYQGGTITHVISGLPRVSTTRTPVQAVTLQWDKISAVEKRDKCDYYFNLNQKLIMIDDQRYMYEVVVAPSSYGNSRRRAKQEEAESYTAKVQVIILGAGTQLSEGQREAL